ncbi:nucleotidyl transferase AbiEii/AbiGii toxin family protein, partial [bacterium]|nr:nucleotidyl transferase AbiEii/AbiGii toxin family protein [bacterium]
MNSVLTEMLKKHQAESIADKKNAVKEVMQELVLCALSRSGFFKHAAFYGGTALRIFYGLDRFSEDLDFSLMKPDPDFELAGYFPDLKKELASYGLNVEISEKRKTKES